MLIRLMLKQFDFLHFRLKLGRRLKAWAKQVGGLFASVQQSTQAVDSARLFAERALYYAERAPFLFRLQTRLGVHEIMDDAGLVLAQISSSLSHKRTVKNLMKEFQQTLLITRATLGDANSTVKSIKTLMNQLSENPEAANSTTAAITQLSHLLKECNLLLSSAPYQESVSHITDIANQVNGESNQSLKKLAWLGVGLISFFWTMFVLSKLFYQYLQFKLFGRPKPANQDEYKSKAA